MNHAIEAQLNKETSKKVQYLMIVTVLVGAFIWSLSAIQFNAVDDGGWKIAVSIIQGILKPDMDLLWNFSQQGVFTCYLKQYVLLF